MYYTWGYLKENALSKLNLTEEEANQQDFLSRFPYYANEAMTQLCSVRPDEKLFYIVVTDENLNTAISLPDDFISFNDASPIYRAENERLGTAVGDDFVEYIGYNKISCKVPGIYHIPYNARWFFFTKELQNADIITAPADICEAIPSYVASQCLKIDDELKAAIYRNEFEVFLSRVDDTSFRRQRDFCIGGGW